MASHYLAQINIARLIAPLDDPKIAGFVSQLDAVNRLAEASPGFVWRLKSPEGNATDIAYNDDPFVIVNMSVWKSLEALKNFTYQSQHLQVFHDRKLWFEKMALPHYCLWWVPCGQEPTVAEGRERLERYQRVGSTPESFWFSEWYPAPLEKTDARLSAQPLPHETPWIRNHCVSEVGPSCPAKLAAIIESTQAICKTGRNAAVAVSKFSAAHMTTLREAVPSDTEPLIEMMRGLWTNPTSASTFNESMSRKCLAMLFGDPALGRAYLINDIEGYAVIVFGFSLEFGRDAFIDELFLKQEHRGRGTGSAVLDLLSSRCEELGVQALHLEVADANDRAESLYARKSFKRHNRRLMTRWLTSEVPAS